jgi:hypothetical protein
MTSPCLVRRRKKGIFSQISRTFAGFPLGRPDDEALASATQGVNLQNIELFLFVQGKLPDFAQYVH